MGLVGQSFCAALQQELTEYYRLLAVLEGQQQVGDAGFVGEGASGSLTLRRLMVWTYDPLMRLRTLAALVDSCKGEICTYTANVIPPRDGRGELPHIIIYTGVYPCEVDVFQAV